MEFRESKFYNSRCFGFSDHGAPKHTTFLDFQQRAAAKRWQIDPDSCRGLIGTHGLAVQRTIQICHWMTLRSDIEGHCFVR